MSNGFKPISGLATLLGSIPLLAVALGVYLFYASVGNVDAPILTLNGVTLSGGFVALACAGLVLPFEWAKSADTGFRGQIDLALSVILFCVLWLLFFTQGYAATPYFLILCLVQTADALGGGTVAVLSARRDFATGA